MKNVASINIIYKPSFQTQGVLTKYRLSAHRLAILKDDISNTDSLQSRQGANSVKVKQNLDKAKYVRLLRVRNTDSVNFGISIL